MKNAIKSVKPLILTGIFLTGLHVNGQTSKDFDTIYIKTSAICGMCKERIENALLMEKGVKNAVLDLNTKIVMVVYRRDKNYPENLKKAITFVGHDADEMPADEKAYAKLPACCKKDAKLH